MNRFRLLSHRATSFLLLLWIGLFFPCYAEESIDAKEIIRKMELILRGNSSHSHYRMTITDPDWQRVLTINAWEKRLDNKTYIRILSPPKEEGIVTLKIGLEMWNYLPRVERIVKIPPSMMMQSWMGSDFTNDDLVKVSSLIKDYSQRVLNEEEYQGFHAYRIELIPHPDAAVVWGKVLVWARKEDSMPLHQEFFNERGEVIRMLTFSDFRMMHGRVIPARWEMIPLKKEGRKTVMEVLDLEIDPKIDDAIFSLKGMRRYR